jgi:hypothetical protein
MGFMGFSKRSISVAYNHQIMRHILFLKFVKPSLIGRQQQA